MPEFGQIRNADGTVSVFLPMRSGWPPVVAAIWIRVAPQVDVYAALSGLPSGTVVDHEALLHRHEVVVVALPPGAPERIDDSTFEALIEEAERMR